MSLLIQFGSNQVNLPGMPHFMHDDLSFPNDRHLNIPSQHAYTPLSALNSMLTCFRTEQNGISLDEVE